jgi:hypothetical protein
MKCWNKSDFPHELVKKYSIDNNVDYAPVNICVTDCECKFTLVLKVYVRRRGFCLKFDVSISASG